MIRICEQSEATNSVNSGSTQMNHSQINNVVFVFDRRPTLMTDAHAPGTNRNSRLRGIVSAYRLGCDRTNLRFSIWKSCDPGTPASFLLTDLSFSFSSSLSHRHGSIIACRIIKLSRAFYRSQVLTSFILSRNHDLLSNSKQGF